MAYPDIIINASAEDLENAGLFGVKMIDDYDINIWEVNPGTYAVSKKIFLSQSALNDENNNPEYIVDPLGGKLLLVVGNISPADELSNFQGVNFAIVRSLFEVTSSLSVNVSPRITVGWSNGERCILKENEYTSNKVTNLKNNKNSDIKYPTVKAVYDYVNDILENISSSFEKVTNKVSTIEGHEDDVSAYPSVKALNNVLKCKQDTLISGTNIKTVNGESILGSGNIDISGNINFPEKTLSSNDFIQGYRQLGVDVSVSDYYVTLAEVYKVKAGNKITISPNGRKIWLQLSENGDYSLSGQYLLNLNEITEDFEYIFETDGYLNINVNNNGQKIKPSDYNCDILINFDNNSVRIESIEEKVNEIEKSRILSDVFLNPKIKNNTTVVNNCQDVSKWNITNTNVTAVDTVNFIMWSQSIHCDKQMRSTADTYNLIDNYLVIKLRINSIEAGHSLFVRLGNKNNPSVGAVYELMRGAVTTPVGEWREITIPYSAFKYKSNGDIDFGKIDDITIYADNQATSGVDGIADWNVQYIGTRPRKSTKGVVSFTFDDGYKSQYTGVKLLAEKGITSTVFHIVESTGKGNMLSVEELQQMVEYYNADIEVHGDVFDDGNGNYGLNALSDEELEAYWTTAQNFLKENGLSAGRHMAYPGGYHDKRVVDLARKYFDSCRTIQYYVPLETYVPADDYRLRAVSGVGGGLDSSGNYKGVSVEKIKEYVDRAVESGSWLILVFHRIGEIGTDTDNASMYCTESDLREIADYVLQSGADVRNIAEVYDVPATVPPTSNVSGQLEVITAQQFEESGEDSELFNDEQSVISSKLFLELFSRLNENISDVFEEISSLETRLKNLENK